MYGAKPHQNDLLLQGQQVVVIPAALPGAWPFTVSTRAGWLARVSILPLGEMESWICNLYLSTWDTPACCWDAKQDKISAWQCLQLSKLFHPLDTPALLLGPLAGKQESNQPMGTGERDYQHLVLSGRVLSSASRRWPSAKASS